MSGLRARSPRSVRPGETGIALLDSEDIDGPFARPELDEPVLNGGGGRGGRATARLHEGVPTGEQRRERCGMGAAGPVRRRHVVALDGNLDVLFAVEEVISRFLSVPTGHDHRGRTELVDRFCQQATCLGARTCASWRFGVTTVAIGKRRVTSASIASSWRSLAPLDATITGSTTSGSG